MWSYTSLKASGRHLVSQSVENSIKTFKKFIFKHFHRIWIIISYSIICHRSLTQFSGCLLTNLVKEREGLKIMKNYWSPSKMSEFFSKLLSACLGLILPNQYCLIIVWADFWVILYYFMGHAYFFVIPTKNHYYGWWYLRAQHTVHTKQ